MASGRVAVEPRVQKLVDALNALPGVYTFASCGGHDRATSVKDVAAREFYVNFSIELDEGGWDSLERIVETRYHVKHGWVGVTVWHDTAGVNFELHGYDDAAPDELALAFAS
jgi:hypothetical protein